MSNETPAPRTVAQQSRLDWWVDNHTDGFLLASADFARTLERELTETTHRLHAERENIRLVECEREKLREELAERTREREEAREKNTDLGRDNLLKAQVIGKWSMDYEALRAQLEAEKKERREYAEQVLGLQAQLEAVTAERDEAREREAEYCSEGNRAKREPLLNQVATLRAQLAAVTESRDGWKKSADAQAAKMESLTRERDEALHYVNRGTCHSCGGAFELVTNDLISSMEQALDYWKAQWKLQTDERDAATSALAEKSDECEAYLTELAHLKLGKEQAVAALAEMEAIGNRVAEECGVIFIEMIPGALRNVRAKLAEMTEQRDMFAKVLEETTAAILSLWKDANEGVEPGAISEPPASLYRATLSLCSERDQLRAKLAVAKKALEIIAGNSADDNATNADARAIAALAALETAQSGNLITDDEFAAAGFGMSEKAKAVRAAQSDTKGEQP